MKKNIKKFFYFSLGLLNFIALLPHGQLFLLCVYVFINTYIIGDLLLQFRSTDLVTEIKNSFKSRIFLASCITILLLLMILSLFYKDLFLESWLISILFIEFFLIIVMLSVSPSLIRLIKIRSYFAGVTCFAGFFWLLSFYAVVNQTTYLESNLFNQLLQQYSLVFDLLLVLAIFGIFNLFKIARARLIDLGSYKKVLFNTNLLIYAIASAVVFSFINSVTQLTAIIIVITYLIVFIRILLTIFQSEQNFSKEFYFILILLLPVAIGLLFDQFVFHKIFTSLNFLTPKTINWEVLFTSLSNIEKLFGIDPAAQNNFLVEQGIFYYRSNLSNLYIFDWIALKLGLVGLTLIYLLLMNGISFVIGNFRQLKFIAMEKILFFITIVLVLFTVKLSVVSIISLLFLVIFFQYINIDYGLKYYPKIDKKEMMNQRLMYSIVFMLITLINFLFLYTPILITNTFFSSNFTFLNNQSDITELSRKSGFCDLHECLIRQSYQERRFINVVSNLYSAQAYEEISAFTPLIQDIFDEYSLISGVDKNIVLSERYDRFLINYSFVISFFRIESLNIDYEYLKTINTANDKLLDIRKQFVLGEYYSKKGKYQVALDYYLASKRNLSQIVMSETNMLESYILEYRIIELQRIFGILANDEADKLLSEIEVLFTKESSTSNLFFLFEMYISSGDRNDDTIL